MPQLHLLEGDHRFGGGLLTPRFGRVQRHRAGKKTPRSLRQARSGRKADHQQGKVRQQTVAEAAMQPVGRRFPP
jgi:hypothetical protein